MTGLTTNNYYRRVATVDNEGHIGNWNTASFLVAIPILTFNGVTPTDGSIVTGDTTNIELNIEYPYGINFSRQRDGVTYPIYNSTDSGLILMMNFDNVAALGESTTISKDLSVYGTVNQIGTNI